MFIFPLALFGPKNVKLRLAQRTISGGQSISGDEDVIATDGGGRWELTLSGIELVNPAKIRAWEAWESYLDGGVTECAVPVATISRANRPMHSPSPLTNAQELFTEVQSLASDYITAEVATDAALRATTLQMSILRGGDLKGGETFSINHASGPSVYRVRKVNGDGSLSIRPPLRDSVIAGQPVNLDWPLMRARLAPDQDISPDVFLGKYAGASITFVEATH